MLEFILIKPFDEYIIMLSNTSLALPGAGGKSKNAGGHPLVNGIGIVESTLISLLCPAGSTPGLADDVHQDTLFIFQVF